MTHRRDAQNISGVFEMRSGRVYEGVSTGGSTCARLSPCALYALPSLVQYWDVDEVGSLSNEARVKGGASAGGVAVRMCVRAPLLFAEWFSPHIRPRAGRHIDDVMGMSDSLCSFRPLIA